ncbi:hypothetical protein P2318_20695 [Myxococcaceae bacterium GXIMD 01537]
MRPLLLSPALLLLGACSAGTEPRPPPQTRFVYPSGIVHRDVPSSENGALYVASANFDKCFDTGSVIALNLDDLGLPPFGSPVPREGPVQLQDLKVGDDAWVQIQSFAGEMVVREQAGLPPRLFVPSRAEGSYLQGIDIEGSTSLTCANASGRNCIDGALSLLNVPGQVDDLPRAPAPIGVSVAPDADEVWVTHTEVADSPIGTALNPEGYVVRVPGESLKLTTDDFYPVGNAVLATGGTNSSAVGRRYVFATGRNYTIAQGTGQQARFVLRLIDRRNRGRVLESDVGAAYRTLEARGVAMTSDETRLYLVARAPDTLLVLDVAGAQADVPTVTVVNAIALPDGASEVRILPRAAGRGDVVVVTCSLAGVVAVYDDEVGQLVAQVSGVGVQPFGLTTDPRGNGARLYTTNFGDGRVAVIDLPNLDNPQDARLVAHLGKQQELDPDQGTTVCQESKQ